MVTEQHIYDSTHATTSYNEIMNSMNNANKLKSYSTEKQGQTYVEGRENPDTNW